MSPLQLLGLKGRESYLEPHIVAAFEDLASTVVEEGYSSRVQDGKLRMLDQAVDEVSHSTVSRDGEVQVQWDDLPGALALLQEVCSCNPVTCPAEVINCSGILRGKVLVSAPAVLWTQLSTLTRMIAFQVGEYDLVIAMGTKLLEKWESRGFRRDILLSMALAQCGLAADTFAVQQASCTEVVLLTSAVQAYNNTGSTLCQTGAGSNACGITVNNGSMLRSPLAVAPGPNHNHHIFQKFAHLFHAVHCISHTHLQTL